MALLLEPGAQALHDETGGGLLEILVHPCGPVL